jgi:hypothetical protein
MALVITSPQWVKLTGQGGVKLPPKSVVDQSLSVLYTRLPSCHGFFSQSAARL